MGNRKELCVTLYPAAMEAGRVASAVETHLQTAAAADYVPEDLEWAQDDYSFTDLTVTIGDDEQRVFVGGSTFVGRETEVWREGILAVEIEAGQAAAFHTQEAGYMGWGFIYEWQDGQYEQTSKSEIEAEGNYGDVVLEWFKAEHDITPGNFRYGRLEQTTTPRPGE